MISKPKHGVKINTFEAETTAVIADTGFREYDARWLFPEQINLIGFTALGLGFGSFIYERGQRPDVIVGHDYRSYSASVKHALIIGLIASGCRVHDIGLALSPMAYFAQFALDVPCVAMITASHNENGWSGVKMGIDRPLTLGPEDMRRLQTITMEGLGIERPGGSYRFAGGVGEWYLNDLTRGFRLNRRIKAVVACGNGTAGAFAPEFCRRLGCEVVELDCLGDYSFPNYNPNPEDLKMLDAITAEVLAQNADVGLAFDGDGDRCGVIDNRGEAIFADKVGVLLARNMAENHHSALFVADVKSTGLFASDPVLDKHGARTVYGKTGHSYMKRAVLELNALAGFEKSGHFFFNAPIGRGYDDGLLAARCVLEMLDGLPGSSLHDLKGQLPKTWGSPTMSAYCPDEIKYQIASSICAHLEEVYRGGQDFAGGKIAELLTVNGVRVVARDGTWGLVRASSNKPELVVVVESPVSEERMGEMFQAVDEIIRSHEQVGEYNQTL